MARACLHQHDAERAQTFHELAAALRSCIRAKLNWLLSEWVSGQFYCGATESLKGKTARWVFGLVRQGLSRIWVKRATNLCLWGSAEHVKRWQRDTEAQIERDNDLMGTVSERWPLRLQLEFFLSSPRHRFPVTQWAQPAQIQLSICRKFVTLRLLHSFLVLQWLGGRGKMGEVSV